MEGNRILFLHTSYLKTHNIVMGQVEVGRNWHCQILHHAIFEENHQKVKLGTSLFCPEVSVHQPNQVKQKMANLLTVAVNPSLLGEGDGRKSNAGAAATTKRQKWDGETELLKVLDNFSGSRRRSGAAKGEGLGPRRALARGRGVAARSLGGATVPDNAGGTPWKKLAASFGKAKGMLAKKTAEAGGREESKAAADKAGGTPGGKQPPRSASANPTGPPKGVQANGAEDSKGRTRRPARTQTRRRMKPKTTSLWRTISFVLATSSTACKPCRPARTKMGQQPFVLQHRPGNPRTGSTNTRPS